MATTSTPLKVEVLTAHDTGPRRSITFNSEDDEDCKEDKGRDKAKSDLKKEGADKAEVLAVRGGQPNESALKNEGEDYKEDTDRDKAEGLADKVEGLADEPVREDEANKSAEEECGWPTKDASRAYKSF